MFRESLKKIQATIDDLHQQISRLSQSSEQSNSNQFHRNPRRNTIVNNYSKQTILQQFTDNNSTTIQYLPTSVSL